MPREVRARMIESLQCSKAELVRAQTCSMFAASAFPSPVSPLQRITMTTEALVSVRPMHVECIGQHRRKYIVIHMHLFFMLGSLPMLTP